MKHPVRFLTVLAALGLLMAVFAGSGTTMVQAVDDGEVGWVSDLGADINYVASDVNVAFHINDDALETTKVGKARMNVSAGTKYINLATEMAGADSDTATSTTIEITGDYIGEATPLVTEGLPTKVNGSIFVTTEAGGGISLLEAVSGDVEVIFQFHIADSYPGNLRDAADGEAVDGLTGTQRVRVISTSDSQGEWVSIAEDDATSDMYSGMVKLSSDAASSGSAGWCTDPRIALDDEDDACQGKSSDDRWADGGVWVQNGDTVTVTYQDSSGASVSSDTIMVDTVSPLISDISPASGTHTSVPNPTISFNVTDTGSGINILDLDITLTIGTTDVDATDVSFITIDNGVRAIYARSPNDWPDVDEGNGNPFPIRITATDIAGNTAEKGDDDSYTIDIDSVKPRIRMAEATSKTMVVAMFDEPLNADSVDSDGSDFEVEDVLVTGAAVDADDAKMVTLTVSDLEPDAKPLVSVVGTVADNAGNSVDTANDAASKVKASDSIGATITEFAIDSPLVGEDGEVKISLAFDEKLATDGIVVSVNGNGKEDVERPEPLEASATFDAGDSPTGMYGVSVQVTDLGSNITSNLRKVSDETPSIGDSDAGAVGDDMKLLTVDMGPIGDANFDGMIDGGDVTVNDISDTDNVMELEVASVDASARTITLASGAPSSDLTVSYQYVPAGHTFQVDQSAPSVMVDPSDGSTVKDQSPFIRIVFDESEYPGDTNTSVTLDSAMLTMPDGTDKDVTGMFQAGTADNMEFIWAASDLALGGYTLTLKATDAAKNTLETSSTFTVAKRTAEIALRPGWNLISIPGSLAPDKRSTNDVFTNGAIDIVLTYDARKRNWFRATRQSDGTLGQPGSSLELSTVSSRTAYWVHSRGVVTQAVDLLGASSQEPPVSIDLVAGWNLIPVRTTEVGTTGINADQYLSGLNWTRAYGYNNTTQVFQSILPGAGAELAENSGYWLYLKDAGVLVP